MVRTILIFAIPLIIASPAHSGEPPESLCVIDGVIDRKCLTVHFERINAELQKLYKSIAAELRKEAEASQVEATQRAEDYAAWLTRRRSLLERSQEAWQQYREAACEAAYQQYQGGSLALPSRLWCLIDLTRQRMQQLRQMYVEN